MGDSTSATLCFDARLEPIVTRIVDDPHITRSHEEQGICCISLEEVNYGVCEEELGNLVSYGIPFDYNHDQGGTYQAGYCYFRPGMESFECVYAEDQLADIFKMLRTGYTAEEILDKRDTDRLIKLKDIELTEKLKVLLATVRLTGELQGP